MGGLYRDIAKEVYPFLPALLFSNKFDSLEKIKKVLAPKLFIHSINDEIVPFASADKLEIARLLTRLYKKDLEPKVVNSYRKGDIRHCYADTSRLEKLGFKSKVNFAQGMEELIEWARLIGAKDKVKFADSTLIKRGLILRSTPH